MTALEMSGMLNTYYAMKQLKFDNGYTTASITLIFNTRYNPRKSEVSSAEN